MKKCITQRALHFKRGKLELNCYSAMQEFNAVGVLPHEVNYIIKNILLGTLHLHGNK